MKFYPDIQTIHTYAKQYTNIPLYTTIPYDGRDITAIYNTFRGACSFLFEPQDQMYSERYTIITLPCTKRFVANETEAVLYEDDQSQVFKGNPMITLQNQLMCTSSPCYRELPVFTGGAIGHVNYDVIRLYEHLPVSKKDGLQVPLLQFGFVRDLIVINHDENVVYFISDMSNQDIDSAYVDAQQNLRDMQKRYLEMRPYTPEPMQESPTLTSNYTKSEFIDMVNQAKQSIKDGEVFQVVLSQRMQCPYTRDPLDAYVKLREAGASSYRYVLDFQDYTIAGLSPECLLQVRGNQLRTMPIAGTRKRGKDAAEDQLLMKSLRNDSKENAEHIMLVDLGRNDIGKVAQIKTVEVHHIKEIALYSHVMHMTSEVTGIFAETSSALDALVALLPAGTLSGAPKIRAMQLINELETTQREIYGGAIAFISHHGQLDACITIRTMIFHKGQVYMQAGAGIVKDSDPQKEYEETLQKLAVLRNALHQKGVRP